MHDVKELAPVIKEFNYPENATLCTDDREPDDLYNEGHLDYVIRVAINEGIPAVEAIKMATFNSARLLGLETVGSIAPGKLANIAIIDDLESIKVSDVFVEGKQIVEEGKLTEKINGKSYPIEKINTIKLKQKPTVDNFKIKCDKDEVLLNIMAYDIDVPIITKIEQLKLKTKDGYIDISKDDSLAALTVFERHGKNGNRKSCIVKNLGIKEGAIASTVSHDCHNLIVLGKNENDMLLAAQTLEKTGGGIVCVLDGKVEAIIELPIAGLLSPKPVEELAPKTALLKQKMREMGMVSSCLLLQIATLALPVIPEVRLSDMGLIDVNNKKIIPVIVE